MSQWHVPDAVVAAFATKPRSLDDGVAASVEQHVASCVTCQDRVARRGGDFDLDTVWAGIEDQIDRVGVGWTGRLGRLTGHSASGRLIAATPGLQASAVVAVVLVVVASSLAARSLDAAGAFLALAPLMPLALVGMSFAPGADPAGEAGLATPLHGIGLLVRRLLAIAALSVTVLLAGTMLVPLDGPRALGWLLPSLALSAATIAGGVRWSTPKVAVALAGAWAAAVLSAARLGSSWAVTSSFLFDAGGQVFFAVATLIAVGIIASRQTTVCQEVL